MSMALDEVLIQAAAQYPATVILSPESVTVLLYASQFLEQRENWLTDNPLDDITPEQWDVIEALVSGLYFEVNNPMLGMIFPVITGGAPQNCILCDGDTYMREDYPLLYDILDSAFITGPDTFVTPNLNNGSVPIGAGLSEIGTDFYIGMIGGEEKHSLDEDENGEHSHTDIGHVHSYQPPGVSGLAVAPGELPVALPNFIPSVTGSASANIQSSGIGAPHNNMPPFVAVKYVVIAR